jgi:hypothetical protein
VRVSIFWATVAPNPQSRTRPDFDATNPAAYPAGAWDRYDQLVRLASQRGIGVNFNITSPAPRWATASNPPREQLASTYDPSAQEFGQFVTAIGSRYSGNFRPGGAPAATATRQDNPPLCAVFNTCPPVPPAPTGQPLPRVDFFSIWNEPNQPGWLTPQWVQGSAGDFAEAGPRIYRGLLDAAYAGLQVSGHGGDTILIGETAPKGVPTTDVTRAMAPLRFIRALYCVGDDVRPLSGDAAKVRGCPETDAQSAAFPDAHPALFRATGFGHHPYELYARPTKRPSNADFVTLAVLPRLTRTLQRIFGAYSRDRQGLPLYLTEFGYNTDPPNPTGVTLRSQAAFLNQAEYMARRDPAVQTLTQFLLVDAARPSGDATSAGYATTFQTGLKFVSGKKKPAYDAYTLPIHLPQTTQARGGRLRVWGLVRPARRLRSSQRVAIQLRANGRLRTLRTVRTRRASGVLDVRLRIPARGSLRLVWHRPGGKSVVVSRSVAVHVRR